MPERVCWFKSSPQHLITSFEKNCKVGISHCFCRDSNCDIISRATNCAKQSLRLPASSRNFLGRPLAREARSLSDFGGEFS